MKERPQKKRFSNIFSGRRGSQFKEQRQHKRFAAKIPVRLEAITSSRLRHLYVETKDISATGAFVFTKEASYIPDDTRFIIDLTIPKKRNKKWKDFINCTGTIVRSTSEGIAIRFNRPVELFV
jgi:PilZ domain-containing protein